MIGLTGPLGVGKSSLINSLLAHLRARGSTVAVVAVDPSSPFSGGSVLGDRIRLDRRPGDSGVFIRSMASRGHTGGLAVATRDVARVLDAAGFRYILLETVGSGQVDVAVRDVATTSVVVLVPHLGDEVQTLKAGLFEIADVFCVNKCDLPGAEKAARELSELASLGVGADGWRPTVVRTSAADGTGVAALWDSVCAHEEFLDRTGLRAEGERRRAAREIIERVRDRVGAELALAVARDRGLRHILDEVVARRMDPGQASERLFRDLRRGT